jgi:mutual gliding-motility protein MglA
VSNLNVMARELGVKIVFYGPGLSGKTSTLRKIYESVRPSNRGEMMSLATEGDRTLFFDFLPVKIERVGDCVVRLAMYTVPGQVFYNATRKLVLQGSDGVVFVADSQPEAMDQNRESYRNLGENLEQIGIRLENFPHVIQYNKRDIAKALPVETLRDELNIHGVPDFETCATSGRGVMDVLKAITRLVIKDLKVKKVVPSRAASPNPRSTHFPSDEGPEGLQDQIQEHLEHAEPELPVSQPVALPPPPGTGVQGPAAALAPEPLLDYARAADAAFAQGDTNGCIRACQEAVRRALAFAGEGDLAQQAVFLGVSGPDLLRLQHLSTRSVVRLEDAAFSLYVLMQVLVRMMAAGLPVSSP